MKRQFFRDSAIYGGATLLSSLSNVVLVSVYTRGLEQASYGVVEYVNVLQVLLQVVVGLELTQAIARYFGGAESDVERRAYASTGFWFLIVAYGSACTVLFVAADQVGALVFGGAVPTAILRSAVVSVYLGILFYAVRSQLRWELRPLTYAAASAIVLLSTVAVSAYLLLLLRTGIIGVFVGSSAGYAAGLALCLVGLRGTYRRIFDVPKLRAMLAFSVPLTVSSLALFAANYGDRLVVRAAMGFDDLGVYAAGAKVAGVIALASAGFQLGAAPLIYRNFRLPETPGILAQLLRLFASAGLLGVVALATVSLELLTVFTSPAYIEAWRIVPVLALATVLASAYVFLPGLSINNMTSWFAAINITSAAVTLASIAVLARSYGIQGAALGALCGAGTGFALHAAFSQRVYALPVSWWRIGAAISIAFTTIAIDWGLGQPGQVFLIGRIALFVVSAIGMLIVLLQPADRALMVRVVPSRFRSTTGGTGA